MDDTPKEALEAIEYMVDTNIHRYTRKQIAMMLRPKMKIEAAKAWFTNCLNPNGDQHFHPDDVDLICKITGRADIYLNYLADRHGFERSAKKIMLDPIHAEIVLRQALKDMDINPDEAIKECLLKHKPLFAIKEKAER